MTPHRQYCYFEYHPADNPITSVIVLIMTIVINISAQTKTNTRNVRQCLLNNDVTLTSGE